MGTFKERLGQAMFYQHIKQVDIVKKTGLQKSKVSQYVNGLSQPNGESLVKLATALNVTPEWLMGEGDDSPAQFTRKNQVNIDGLKTIESSFSLEDLEILDKYHKLDDHGHQVVSFLLDAEYARVQDIMAAVQGGTVGSSGTIAVPLLQDALSRKAVGTIPVQPDGEIKKGEDDLIALPVTNDAMAPFVHPGDKLIVRQQTEVNSGDIAVVLLDGVQVVCKQVIKEGENLRLVPLNKRYEDMVIHQDDIRKKRFEIIGRVVKSVQAG